MRDDEIDPLTGLWNRRGVQRRLDEVARAAADGAPGRTDRWRTVVALDIDRLADVNRRYGNDVGDRVLADVARRLALCAGNQSVVARVGGDEFLVLSPHEPEECQGFYALLADELDDGAGGTPTVTISAGAAPLHASDTEESRRQADLALWQAKAEGGARLSVYAAETDRFVQRRGNLADRVRRQHEEILRLLELTGTDALTDLGNRRAMDRHVEILERRRAPALTAVLFIDLDRFGELNRLRSDYEGDEALRRVGVALREICRRSDLVVPDVGRAAFRKGGEEFVVVAPVASAEDARALGERVRAAVEALAIPHGAPGQPVLTATIGIGIADERVPVGQALREAGVVMTRLKNDDRRNCVALVDPDNRPTPLELPHETDPSPPEGRGEDGASA